MRHLIIIFITVFLTGCTASCSTSVTSENTDKYIVEFPGTDRILECDAVRKAYGSWYCRKEGERYYFGGTYIRYTPKGEANP